MSVEPRRIFPVRVGPHAPPGLATRNVAFRSCFAAHLCADEAKVELELRDDDGLLAWEIIAENVE